MSVKVSQSEEYFSFFSKIPLFQFLTLASIVAISWAGPAHPPGVEWQEGQGPPPGVAWKGNSRSANDCGKFVKV